jgi:chemotaxis signal transduction protein
VVLINLARILRTSHVTSLAERKVLVVRAGELLVGLEVDAVREPELFPAEKVSRGDVLANSGGVLWSRALKAVVTSDRGLIPVLAPEGLLSRTVRRKLEGVLAHLPSAGPGV